MSQNKETGHGDQKLVGIAFTGGARHKELSPWELGNSITMIEFTVYKDNIDITYCCYLALTNAEDQPCFLCKRVQCWPCQKKCTKSRRSRAEVLLSGGKDTKTMVCTNDLLQFKLPNSKKINKMTFSGSKKSEIGVT